MFGLHGPGGSLQSKSTDSIYRRYILSFDSSSSVRKVNIGLCRSCLVGSLIAPRVDADLRQFVSYQGYYAERLPGHEKEINSSIKIIDHCASFS